MDEMPSISVRTTPYRRTPSQRALDPAAAKPFEAAVRAHLPAWTTDNTESFEELDFVVPGFAVEVKQKFQRLTTRWTELWPSVPEEYLFVLDELSLRKALKHWPAAYFVIEDRPGGRLFLTPVTELVSVERVRVQRNGKAKLLLDLRNFRQLADLSEIVPLVAADLAAQPWLRPGAIGEVVPPEVRAS